jgi:dipeptidyl aminopeptidase/acylaminoacyl peptidase
MKIVRLVLIAFALLTSSALAQTPADSHRRSITEKDLFDFVWVANPQVSPDGSRTAFTRVVVDSKRSGYETSIWTVDNTGGASPVRLTNGKHDGSPRWSPDGKRLAFVRGGEKDEAGKPRPPQIAVLSLSGGEAWVITDLPKGASNPVWSPDGKRIAFLSGTSPEDIEKARAKAAHRAAHGAAKPSDAKDEKNTSVAETHEPESDHESDVHLVTRAVYRSNGEGYLDFKHPDHIWVLDVPTTSDELTTPRQLTKGEFDEDSPVWSPDGKLIYFLTQRVREPYYDLPTTDIYTVSVDGSDVKKLKTLAMDVGSIALSADGLHFAFHGEVQQPIRSYSQPDLWVMDNAPNAEPRNLTANYDFDMGSGVGGDNAPPRGGRGTNLRWTADGKSLIDTVAKQGNAYLVRVDASSGAVTEISPSHEAVLDYSMTADAKHIVALLSNPTRIGDLFELNANGNPTQLTDTNRKLWSQLNLTMPEEINYTSFDGKKVQAWIQRPPDFDSHKKYPLILNIHGGPHSAYGWIFDHEFQWMAAKGYVVLYVNPRGSTSYGQDFGNIIQYNYPGDDYKDLMVGVDEVLKRGYVDAKRLGVTGGSGGGVLTDWTVTHTNRFAAAVSQRDISNWASWWYTADFTLFQPTWFKAPPFKDPQDYTNRSAITYVENIRTPILFVLGESDSRTPPDSGGEQLFRALKFLKRPTAMVLFPRETHELSRSGEPWHRIERLDHIVHWFDKYLQGASYPEYDMPGDSVDKPKELPKPADSQPPAKP